MSIESPAVLLPHADAGRFSALKLGSRAWWRSLPVGVRLPEWPLMLAALLILGLLLAFHGVVSEAAKQGEVRRKAKALLAEATWRCNTARPPSTRDSCMRELNAAFGLDPLLSARDVAGASPVK